LITNLPENCCVEVPCLVDKGGVHPCYVGELPPQLASLCRTNINVQELAARGCLTGDKQMIRDAVALDPLTAAVLSLDEIENMVNELFEAQAKWLSKKFGNQ
jgi:alpha-galactosidase